MQGVPQGGSFSAKDIHHRHQPHPGSFPCFQSTTMFPAQLAMEVQEYVDF